MIEPLLNTADKVLYGTKESTEIRLSHAWAMISESG
jgi:hypothetical protein